MRELGGLFLAIVGVAEAIDGSRVLGTALLILSLIYLGIQWFKPLPPEKSR